MRVRDVLARKGGDALLRMLTVVSASLTTTDPSVFDPSSPASAE